MYVFIFIYCITSVYVVGIVGFELDLEEGGQTMEQYNVEEVKLDENRGDETIKGIYMSFDRVVVQERDYYCLQSEGCGKFKAVLTCDKDT